MKQNILQESHLKDTKRRRAVLHVLENSDSPMAADKIYSQVIKSAPMSVSTTYRILSVLSEKGILLKNLSQDGKTYYQINNRQHRHYLTCTSCNETIVIDDCPLNALEDELNKDTGYIITGHHLEFTGICPKCAGKK
ncbi:MAG TPA: transcriptional repressor [Bacillota bacterium]|nr:transcriptional repressor [Bacillota bacterium]